jgi:GNAT superfamily N-acetyltransferase
MPPEFEIVARVADATELHRLAAAVGWLHHYDWPTVAAALEGSLHGAVALHDGVVVGTARLVGDGVHYFYVQDVLVDPAHSDEGIGSALVSHLLDRVAETAPAEAFVGLFSSPEARGMYADLGFTQPDDMTGMTLTIPAGTG